MDTMGEDTPRLSSGTNGTTEAGRTEEAAGQPTCTFGGVYACRLSVSVWPRSVEAAVVLVACVATPCPWFSDMSSFFTVHSKPN